MTGVSTNNGRPHRRMRRWAYTPLVAAVAAGAICAGVGVGTATPTTAPDAVIASAGTPDTAPGSAGDKNWWSLYNYTGLPVYGEFSVQTGKDVSDVKLVEDWPLPSGNHESRGRNDSVWWESYWMGHICYNHTWYNFPRTDIEMNQDASFVLWSGKVGDAESGGRSKGIPADGVYATWNSLNPSEPSKVDLIRNPYEAPC